MFHLFERIGVGAAVLTNERGSDFLEIDERGFLALNGKEPRGFYLSLAMPKEARIVITQKNVGKEKGEYHQDFLSEMHQDSENLKVLVMNDSIDVIRAGPAVWTHWHGNKPNRVDCWVVDETGKTDLFQIGVITHDNGQTWRLLGEYRWRGQLFRHSEKIVGKPDEPKWGAFDVRKAILNQPDFLALVESARIQNWEGTDEELHPPLPKVPGHGYAVMQWFIAFAGQSGQGPAYLYDGSNAWVHGVDILDLPPDEDGIKRLWQNDIVSYRGTARFGKKPSGPPKLLNVKKVV